MTAAPGAGHIFVVSAPSGTGKTTVCRAAVARDPRVVFSVSHTTRPPRPGERPGVDYHFVDEERFRRMAAEGAFLEHAEYNGALYGTSWRAIEEPLARGLDVLLEIEIQGARQVRARRPDARLVFLLPPSLEALEARLRSRGTDPESAVQARLAIAQRELREAPRFDYWLVNDRLEEAVAALLEVVRAVRAGREEQVRQHFGRAAVERRLAPELRRALRG